MTYRWLFALLAMALSNCSRDHISGLYESHGEDDYKLVIRHEKDAMYSVHLRDLGNWANGDELLTGNLEGHLLNGTEGSEHFSLDFDDSFAGFALRIPGRSTAPFTQAKTCNLVKVVDAAEHVPDTATKATVIMIGMAELCVRLPDALLEMGGAFSKPDEDYARMWLVAARSDPSVWGKVCRDGSPVLDVLEPEVLHADPRQTSVVDAKAMVFDRCDFGRLGFATREEFKQSKMALLYALTGAVALPWLKDDGVASATVRRAARLAAGIGSLEASAPNTGPEQHVGASAADKNAQAAEEVAFKAWLVPQMRTIVAKLHEVAHGFSLLGDPQARAKLIAADDNLCAAAKSIGSPPNAVPERYAQAHTELKAAVMVFCETQPTISAAASAGRADMALAVLPKLSAAGDAIDKAADAMGFSTTNVTATGSTTSAESGSEATESSPIIAYRDSGGDPADGSATKKGGRRRGRGHEDSPLGGADGNGLLDLGGREKGDTRITPGSVNVQGSLSKDIIAKIIRKHWNEIKYCYETELYKNANLNGIVAVAFTIDGTGSVSDANISESTMGNTNVENCMTVRVRRWRFPEPKGGGLVAVTDSWVFNSQRREHEPTSRPDDKVGSADGVSP